MARSIFLLFRTCVLVWVCVCAASAHAAQTDIPSTFVSDIDETVVAKNGSLTGHETSVLRTHTPAGIQNAAQRNVGYNPGMSNVDKLAESRPEGTPMFEDKKPRVVMSVNVERGIDRASELQKGSGWSVDSRRSH